MVILSNWFQHIFILSCRFSQSTVTLCQHQEKTSSKVVPRLALMRALWISVFSTTCFISLHEHSYEHSVCLKALQTGWIKTGMDRSWGHRLCSEKRCLFVTQGTVYVLERYLLSSVPNQLLNSPSSLLNDACNRTRLQHRADKTTWSQRGHLNIHIAWISLTLLCFFLTITTGCIWAAYWISSGEPLKVAEEHIQYSVLSPCTVRHGWLN